MRTRSLTKALALAVAILVVGPAGAALACGGLVAPNGTVSLTRTTTLAAYHDGVEHYLTSFEYAGATAGDVGSIVPLPGVPTRVIKGGAWTLQRLEIEVQPPLFNAERAAASTALAAGDAQVLLETTVDSLDITVLKGGAVAVGTWASDHGFFLPPDAPEVLDFYARRSPIFMAVKFNAERAAAQGITEGNGTPVDVVIPTTDPWVPLRILTLGAQPDDRIEADVFLLTDGEPVTLPQAVKPNGDPDQTGLIRRVSEPASQSLLDDLRSDKHMNWVPEDAWLTFIDVNVDAEDLIHDLAIDASGFGRPDPVAAGYEPADQPFDRPLLSTGLWAIVAAITLLLVLAEVERRRLHRPAV
ncbi:MAG TPA: DUF2330 domain-containing protein [Actinomycetota bacterium]|jgi:hypothetical protein|nr:DUF2330 domain-containing protein [Actinomycetota bacterium]